MACESVKTGRITCLVKRYVEQGQGQNTRIDNFLARTVYSFIDVRHIECGYGRTQRSFW
jgi:hypothetical protein